MSLLVIEIKAFLFSFNQVSISKKLDREIDLEI
jgi:hypothetical protein